MNQSLRILGAVFLGGLIAGAALWSVLSGSSTARAVAADAPAADGPPDTKQLRAELAMFLADYHASNLWFAGRAQNWPLAGYYWDKVMMHMKSSADADPSGKRKADLQAILNAIDRSPTMQVGEAIEKKDLAGFGQAYRSMLQGCFNCHKVAGLAYLRPRFPVPPSSAIINVDTSAEWPK
jgi:hypothetical protein